MRLVIVTGMSGAGKTRALRFLEDLGYFCVDNLPSMLIEPFVELCTRAQSTIPRAALGVDIRSGELFDIQNLLNLRAQATDRDVTIELLFMDCAPEQLLVRYKETRRDHPLTPQLGSLEKSIARERQMLLPLREKADYVMDTTDTPIAKLRENLIRLFYEGEAQPLKIEVVSFGFKHGTPADADMVFDVRFLPNPFYVAELKEHTGLEPAVRDYVFSTPDASAFLGHVLSLLEFLLPRFVAEGKNRLVIAVGCTGGMHRSVALAQAIGQSLTEMGYSASIAHRNL